MVVSLGTSFIREIEPTVNREGRRQSVEQTYCAREQPREQRSTSLLVPPNVLVAAYHLDTLCRLDPRTAGNLAPDPRNAGCSSLGMSPAFASSYSASFSRTFLAQASTTSGQP